MAKPGRPISTIQLTTKSDPTLWKYDSLREALCANIALIASLIDPDTLSENNESKTANTAVQNGQNEKRGKR